MIVLGDGTLLEDFRALTSVDVLEGVPQDGAQARSLAARLSADGFTDAIVNTTASGLFTRPLRDAGIRVVSLIHELPDLISAHGLRSHARTIAECADKIVFPAEPVRRGFERFTRLPDEKVVVRPQGLYKRNAIRAPSEREAARQRLRERIGVAPETEIVIGIGYGDRRKGLDLFVEAGTKVCAERAHVAFVWVGNLDLDLERAVLERICNAGLLSRFHFTGHETETDVFYAGADLYAMTSREDPFPSVVLEALEVGVPAVGFEGAGGFTALAAEHCVTLVPAFDTSAFARAVADMLEDDTRRNRAGAAGKAIISRDFGFRRYVFDLLSATSAPPPRVSVVVPNYNYRDYLQQRLASIVAQSVPVYEVIVLDDASTDGSREWLETELYKLFPEAQLIINDANSGSVFRQWLKGVQLARGEFVWIAEADDLAEPNFLEVALRGLSDPDVVLSYTQSKQIDGAGNVLASHYGEYVADISRERWEHQYITSGLAEIREALAIKNTIPNVSGVLFRRQPLVAVLSKHIDALVQYKVAGDWATYVELLGGGRVAFSPEPLNLHRRHDTSVTLSRFDLSQLTEIMRVQKQVRDRFDLDHEVRARAAAYAQELYEQFGLASESHPSIGKHPDLASLL